MTKKVLFVISSHQQVEGTDKTTGFNLVELAKPCKLFKQHHYQCELASVKGGKAIAEPDSVNLEDSDIRSFWEQSQELIENTHSITEFNPENYCGLYFVGGFGAMWDFSYDRTLKDFGENFYQKGGVIGAVCHGPAALVNIKNSEGQPLAAGKTVTGFTNDEENSFDFMQYYPECPKTHTKSLEDLLRAVGANYCKGAPQTEHVVRDERIVTGQNPASAVGVAAQMLEIMQQLESS